MLIIDCEQRSEQWFAERLGKPSASKFSEILSPTGIVSKQRQGYLYELAAQRISGMVEEGYVSAAMAEGISREDESRTLYELLYGVTVRQVGMVFPDEKKQYLCSPDGLVLDQEYGLELKNVLPKTQVQYLLAKELPLQYKPQIQGSLLVTGFECWHFMAYCPGLPPLIIECHRDEKFLEKLHSELIEFNQELEEIVRKLS